MSQYTPGLEVAPWKTVRRVRELPIPGRALVTLGQRVKATDSVLAAELAGDIDIVRIAERMSIEPIEVAETIRVKVGDHVTAGQVVCEHSSFFGLFVARCESPSTGVVEFFIEANAHLGIRGPGTPLEVTAYVDGTIVDVQEGQSVTIETTGALIQGIFGVGGESGGLVHCLDLGPDTIVKPEHIQTAAPLTGKILVGGATFTTEALRAAAAGGVTGVMTGSIDSLVLRSYAGFEIGVSITGDEDVPFPLVITEGFGLLSLSPRIVELARQLHGRPASINGTTQVRAGAIRPELIVGMERPLSAVSAELTADLHVGSRVRVVRVPYFGQFGTVTELPHERREIPTGASMRVLGARLDDGREIMLPRANVELVAG